MDTPRREKYAVNQYVGCETLGDIISAAVSFCGHISAAVKTTREEDGDISCK